MPKISVYVPDHMLSRARMHAEQRRLQGDPGGSVSALVQMGLTVVLDEGARPDVSDRGRIETLRATRAARQALRDLEATLTQRAPVRRRVRRV